MRAREQASINAVAAAVHAPQQPGTAPAVEFLAPEEHLLRRYS
jgi:hypothetical protein